MLTGDVLDKVSAAAQTTFASLATAAGKVQKLWNSISEFVKLLGGDVGRRVKDAAVGMTREFANKLLRGIHDGFEEFFNADTFIDKLKVQFLGWPLKKCPMLSRYWASSSPRPSTSQNFYDFSSR